MQNSIADAVSRDPHPDDVALIEWTAGLLSPLDARKVALHIRSCERCSKEADRLKAAVELWEDAVERDRREARIGRAVVLAQTRPWWAGLVDLVSAAPLRPALAAMAAGIENASVDFPVYEGPETAEGLLGTIQRRGSECYVRVASSQDKRDAYRGRWVEVVLAQPETDDALLQRRVSVGQYVLLGTDLPITTELVAARLVSDAV